MAGDISKTAWQSVKRLLHPRGRSDSGSLLVEGARAVSTILERRLKPELLLLSPGATPRALQVADTARSLGLDVASISSEQAGDLTSMAHPQGIFSVVSWQPGQTLKKPLPDLILHLSGIRNPANMGALLRTAAGFEVTVSCSPDCVDVTHPTAIRSGAASFLDHQICTNIAMARLRTMAPDHQVVYASASEGTLLSQMNWARHSILVLGGEADGATEPLAADLKVTIDSGIESLNVAVAGGILLWKALHSNNSNTG